MRLVLLCAVSAWFAAAADKPRIFFTESHPLQVSGEQLDASGKSTISVSGGSSPELTEVMKAFTRACPDVAVTSNRDKADYLVRFDHEGTNPTTPFTRGNKVAVFDKNEDLIYITSTRLLSSAVKDTCSAITKRGK
jgi:hypothetical protein